jgi:hypothetical protein
LLLLCVYALPSFTAPPNMAVNRTRCSGAARAGWRYAVHFRQPALATPPHRAGYLYVRPRMRPSATSTYHLTPTDGIFGDVNVILIAVASLATAAAYHVEGHAKFDPGDYLTVEGRHLEARLRLPIHGPVQAAIAGRKPDLIELTLVPGRDAERPYEINSNGFSTYVNNLFFPFLVSYFQRFRASVEQKFKPDRTHWPASWQLGWAVRNATSHSGVAFERPVQKPVSWRGLTFGPADEPAKSLLTLMNGADLLVLLLDMDRDRV